MSHEAKTGDLTIASAALELNCGKTKIYDLVHSGELDAYTLGSPRSPKRIRRDSIEAFKQRHSVKALVAP